MFCYVSFPYSGLLLILKSCGISFNHHDNVLYRGLLALSTPLIQNHLPWQWFGSHPCVFVCVCGQALWVRTHAKAQKCRSCRSSSTYISCWALKSKYHRLWRHWRSLWSLQPLFLARKFSFFESHEDWWIYINECERPDCQLLWNIRRNLSMIQILSAVVDCHEQLGVVEAGTGVEV